MILWVAIIAAIPITAHYQTLAWDTVIYYSAVRSLSAGHDPYADAVAIQQSVHDRNPSQPNSNGPFSYIYSPVTLPLLRIAGMLKPWLAGALYLLAYLFGLTAEIWSTFQAAEREEHNLFLFFVPLALFFPGFLGSDILLSGNVAFILYGTVLATAVIFGWRRSRWRWFYLAVILASCFKAPMLSLLAIPALSARRQWLPVITSAALGMILFVGQTFTWPVLFQSYLKAVSLIFIYNRDFGSSPAGLFTGILFDCHRSYARAGIICYLAYAIPLCGFLFHLSQRYFRGEFGLRQWFPVLLLGVLLLNPRLVEYDTAPLALPMALILWRFLGSFTTTAQRAVGFGLLFLTANIIATHTWSLWKLTEGPLLVICFAAGSWTLLRHAHESEANSQRASEPEVLVA